MAQRQSPSKEKGMKDTERRLLDFHRENQAAHSPEKNKLGKGTTLERVVHQLLDEAQHLSSSTSASLRSIVEELVRLGYDEGRLLGEEFLEIFQDYRLDGILVDNFAEQLFNEENFEEEPPEEIDKPKEKKKVKKQPLRKKIIPTPKKEENQPQVQLPVTFQVYSFNSEHDEEYKAARAEVISFLQDYANDNGRTLSSFLKDAREQYPTVNFHQMFTEDYEADEDLNIRGSKNIQGKPLRRNIIKELLGQQITEAAKLVAGQKYRALFEGVPDPKDDEKKKKARKKSFILDFFFRRIIKIDDENNVVADSDSTEKLVHFLSQQGYELEDLYMVLYREINEMRQLKKKMGETRDDIKKKIAGIIVDRTPYPFLEENFDFDKFFHTNVTPHILAVRENKLPKKNLRLVDITKITPRGMAEVIIPEGTKSPVQQKYEEMKQSDNHFMAEIRKYFNYEDTPNAKLSDAEVLEILQGQLGKVRDLIQFITGNALKIRKENDPIREDCKFIDEIINCDDIRKLVSWMINPKLFIEQHPEHKDEPYKIIGHQARKMIELLLFYRKHAFADEFKNAPEHRDELEQHMRDRLQISNERLVSYEFRIVVPLDANGNEMQIPDEKGRMKPAYEVSFNPMELSEDPEKETTVTRELPDGTNQVYKAYPVEKKNFIEADAVIPNGPDGEGKKVRLSIYLGKETGHLMHCKSENSYLSSLLRGKRPTDLIRWSIVVRNAITSEYVRNFLYENYSSSGSQKISDRAEGRDMSEKQQLGRTDGSAALNGEREFTSAMYATLPQERIILDKDGNQKRVVDHHSIGFETQIYDLNAMLIYNISDYTVSSHSNVYTPEREFGSLFEQLFPPVLYGEKFAKYLVQGFSYQVPEEQPE